jgi:hypothetical protein
MNTSYRYFGNKPVELTDKTLRQAYESMRNEVFIMPFVEILRSLPNEKENSQQNRPQKGHEERQKG